MRMKVITGKRILNPLTAKAGGSPPRTSPSPPVLLQGATSVPTKIKFIPHSILPKTPSRPLLLLFADSKVLVLAARVVRTCSLFKDLNPWQLRLT